MRGTSSLLAWTAFLAIACGASGGLDQVPEGDWGGEHVALAVEAAGARVELDCAHGVATAALTLDAEGRFDVPGYFVQEHGGPVREEEDDRRPARYFGTADGREVRFSIRLTDDGTTLGPFSARRDAPPQLFKCLSYLDP